MTKVFKASSCGLAGVASGLGTKSETPNPMPPKSDALYNNQHIRASAWRKRVWQEGTPYCGTKQGLPNASI